MAPAERPREPLSMVQVEQKLRDVINEMTPTQSALEDARNAETEAWVLLEKAKVLAAASEECPKVQRGQATVADREAWIAEQVLQEAIDHRWAVTNLDIARDKVFKVRDTLSGVQTIAAFQRIAYSVAGVA